MKQKLGIITRLIMALGVAITVPGLTGCMYDDTSNCPRGVKVKVVVSTRSDSQENELDAGQFDNVTLYVFGEDGILLASIPTEIDRIETLEYPDAGTLHTVAMANVNGNEELTELIPGQTTLAEARVLLTREEESDDTYKTPDDLFLGDRQIESRLSSEVIEVPIRRIVAGVYIYSRGVVEYLNEPDATAEDFHIVLGAQYNCEDFLGHPSYTTREVTAPVKYGFDGAFRDVTGASWLDFPLQPDPENRTDYMRVLASYEGMPVSVGLYCKGRLVTEAPIDYDSDGNLLTLENDMLNVIAIDFRGNVSVKIKRSAWGSVAEIGKEYGN